MKQEDIIHLAIEAGWEDVTPWLDKEVYEDGVVEAAKRWVGKQTAFANLIAQHYDKHIADMQAKIDALMLEYCPEDMTEEQRNEWALHQVLSTHAANIDYERLTKIGDVISGKEV